MISKVIKITAASGGNRGVLVDIYEELRYRSAKTVMY